MTCSCFPPTYTHPGYHGRVLSVSPPVLGAPGMTNDSVQLAVVEVDGDDPANLKPVASPEVGQGWAWAGRCGAVRCGAVRCGAVRCGAVRGGVGRGRAGWGRAGWGGSETNKAVATTAACTQHILCVSIPLHPPHQVLCVCQVRCSVRICCPCLPHPRPSLCVQAGEVLRAHLLPLADLLPSILDLAQSHSLGIDSRLYALAVGLQVGSAGGGGQYHLEGGEGDSGVHVCMCV